MSRKENSLPNDKMIHQLICRAKAILFDHNDTLVGAFRSKWAQHKYISRLFYEKRLKDEDIRFHWGKPCSLLLKSLYDTDHIDIAMTYNIATRNKFPKFLFEDTLTTLKFFKEKNKKLGLITASTLESLQYDFTQLGISKHYFDYLQTEDDTIFHKPDPRVFDPVMRWLNGQCIQPFEAVYIGDHLVDFQAASGVGLEFIGVGTGMVSEEQFTFHQIPFISKLSDLCITI